MKICDFGVTVKVDKSGKQLPGELYIGTDAWSPIEVGSLLSSKYWYTFDLIRLFSNLVTITAKNIGGEEKRYDSFRK